MKIRLAEAKDIEVLDDIRAKAVKAHCPSAYDEAQVKALMVRSIENEVYEKAIERSRMMVLTEKGEIGGFIMYRVPSKASSPAHIDWIFITPSMSSKGYGRKMVEKVETMAIEGGNSQVKLISTKNSEPFFRKLGYDNSGPALRQTMEGQVINLQPLFKTVIIPGKD